MRVPFLPPSPPSRRQELLSHVTQSQRKLSPWITLGKKELERVGAQSVWKMLLRAPTLGTCNHCAPCIKKEERGKKYHMTRFQCILSFIPSLLGLLPPFFSPTSWDRFTWDGSYGGVVAAIRPVSLRPSPTVNGSPCTAALQETAVCNH